MPRYSDPTEPIRERAVTYPAIARGASCNQSSFKAGKGTFLFIGPGPKGQGFKAMFKLDRSMAQARKLADTQPDRFEVGSNGWVTTRFTTEKPLPKSVWQKWLDESYEVTVGAGNGKTSGKKKTATKTSSTPKRKSRGR